jgi:MFS family permease
MSLMYLGTGIGQQLLNAGDIQGQKLFIIAGIVFALCLIPVSITGGVHPGLPETKPFRFIPILRKTPLGMLGCFAAGLNNSAFFAMMPVFCSAIGLSLHQLSWIMSLTVFCGLAAQWLVGTLSDRFDRTLVLSAVATAITAVSGIMFMNGEPSFGKLSLGMGMFGILVFAVYPLSVARAHDIFGGQDAVAVSAGLLFAYSIGASISPLLASGVMALLGSPFGLFAYWGVISGTLAMATIFLRKREKLERVPVDAQVPFIPMKITSPVIMALDPRSDVEVGTKVD